MPSLVVEIEEDCTDDQRYQQNSSYKTSFEKEHRTKHDFGDYHTSDGELDKINPELATRVVCLWININELMSESNCKSSKDE